MSVQWPLATASAPPAGDLFRQIWPWLAALLLVVGAGALTIYLLRRFMGRSESSEGDGFTLHDLRELHRTGALSDEEFERAKAAVIGRLTAPDTQERDVEDEPGAAGPAG
ncbi:MAG: hypothetical protein ACYSU7_09250 [Planctomycetota bacterium]|jgi:hypothetical protein